MFFYKRTTMHPKVIIIKFKNIVQGSIAKNRSILSSPKAFDKSPLDII